MSRVLSLFPAFILLASASSALADDASDCQSLSGDPAIAACNRVIAGGGRDLGWAYESRSGAYLKKKDFDHALSDLDRAIKIDPKNWGAYGYRGNVHYEKGDGDRGLADFTKAIQLNPRFVYAYEHRAMLYRETGHADLAVADYENAKRLTPNWMGDYYDRLIHDTQKPPNLYEQMMRDALAATEPQEAPSTKPAEQTPPEEKPQAIAPKSSVGDRVGLSLYEQMMLDSLAVSKPQETPSTKLLEQTPPDDKPEMATPNISTGVRVALVIGNSAYSNVARLPNPVRDSDAIAASLRKANFQTVIVKNDLGRSDMIAALNEFSKQAGNADWAVIYYSGHGMEVEGVNYVVPVDAKLLVDRDAGDEAISLDRLLKATVGARKLHLIILDACRENPFLSKMERTNPTKSIGRGFVRVEPEGGTLVAYAAKEGHVAQDGDRLNSPFVIALTKHLAEPKLEINMLFRRVRDDVLAATHRMQEPYVYGSLPGENFYFVER